MIVQPYRPVTYTIGSASSGMPGMGNTTQTMPGMGNTMQGMPGMGNTMQGMPGMGNTMQGMPGMGSTTQMMPGMGGGAAMGGGGGGGMTSQPPQVTSGSPMTPTGTVVSTPQPVFEQSYIENILRLNLGKTGTFYMTFENNSEWNAKIFKGVIEAAGRDHIIISDRATGQRFLLLMINLDYVTFDEPLTYQYPGAAGNGSRATSRNCW